MHFINVIIKKIVLPEGLTSIGYDVFRGCSGLKEIYLPVGLTSISHGAFSFCNDLKSITYHKRIELLLKKVFGNRWDSLKKIVIDD